MTWHYYKTMYICTQKQIETYTVDVVMNEES